MSKQLESKTIKEFRELVAKGNLNDDVKVVYRIEGGMPHERVEEELRLSGSGKVNVLARDMQKSKLSQEVSTALDRPESQYLFEKIGGGLDSLIPRSEARFLPDSLVGTITIEVKGEKITLYFQPDEEEQLRQNRPIPPLMAEAIQRFKGISQRLLKKEME